MNKQLFISASLLFFLVSCGKTEQLKNETEAVKVKVEKVVFSEDGYESFYSGTVNEENSTSLSFSVMGTVKSVHVGWGSVVHRGQLLATIDDSSIRSAYNAAKASLEQAEDAYRRMKELHDKGSLADIKWMDAQSKYQQACSMEEMARKNLDDCKLYAPYSGVIASKSVEVGQNVSPGLPVFNIVDRQNLNVVVSVPETEISNVNKGQGAVIVIPALADMKVDGEVTEKGIKANPLSRSYEVKIKIKDGDALKRIMPGMITEVFMSGESSEQKIVIPANILQLDENNEYFVWLNNGGKASKRIVSCGDFTANGVIVVSGLHAGDEVIVEGQQKVCEGTVIEL